VYHGRRARELLDAHQTSVAYSSTASILLPSLTCLPSFSCCYRSAEQLTRLSVQFSSISSIVLRGKVSERRQPEKMSWALLETDCDWWTGSEGPLQLVQYNSHSHIASLILCRPTQRWCACRPLSTSWSLARYALWAFDRSDLFIWPLCTWISWSNSHSL